ncbi:MAG: GerMN domain-containing protein [Clostridiales bacterium]|nr:GerMN domain-containing protein [Clostridiales bacterium]
MKRRIAFAAGLAALMLLTGCSLDPLSGRLTTPPPDSPTYQPVSPSAENAARSELRANLYFELQDTGMLSTEGRQIDVKSDTQPEKTVIEALISGPSAQSPELKSIISPDTTVISVDTSDGVLMVTLSSEFLAVPSDAPADWESDAYWTAEIPRRRYLALQSIVCAITDMGEYDGVQVMVDTDGDRVGERVERYYFYSDASKTDGTLMDVAHRDESVVFTPRNTVDAALGYIQGKDWDSLYELLATGDINGERPAYDKFASDMRARAYTLSEYQVGDAMVSGDGQSATVCVDAQFSFRDASARDVSALPIRLVREGEVWKIAYASLGGLLEGF